jgi:hypothetical protein
LCIDSFTLCLTVQPPTSTVLFLDRSHAQRSE